MDRENWDNLSSEKGEFGKTGGVVLENISSFQDCTDACEADANCFQSSHHDKSCFLGMSVRRGSARDSDNEGVWRSGWNRKRLDNWLSKQSKCNHVQSTRQLLQN